MFHFKNIVIGFGKAGKTLAKTFASKGEEVLVIEQSDKMYGGTCINIGCIPSKSLITQAEQGHSFLDAMEKKTTLISMLRQKNYHMIADEAIATVWHGSASFVDDHTLKVTLADGTVNEVVGERIFINTGAQTVLPNIEGLANNPYVVTSTEALSLPTLPKKLVIIGAGYIGLEFGSMFNAYGSSVTILDSFDQFIPREDREVANMVYQDLSNAGIQLQLGITALTVTQNTVTYTLNNETVSLVADVILVAAGRRPNTATLGLDNTSITLNEQGAVVVDDQLRTTADNVWAVGDVKGGPQFTYISLDDFRILKDQLWGDSTRRISDRKLIPYTVFLETPLSNVGHTEASAIAAGFDVKVFKLSMSAVPKAHIVGNTAGMFKVIVDNNTGAIIGATHYGIESQEVINFLALAIKTKIHYTAIRDFIFTHPTISEALNDVLK